MFKTLLSALLALLLSMACACAQVEVNRADQSALDGVRGIGTTLSKAILDERKNGGDFKDWADLQKRVKGIGKKSSTKLSLAGLTVAGLPKPGAVPHAPEALQPPLK